MTLTLTVGGFTGELSAADTRRNIERTPHMPDPTRRATVTGDSRTTRIALDNFPPISTEGGTWAPRLLSIRSEQNTDGLPVTVVVLAQSNDYGDTRRSSQPHAAAWSTDAEPSEPFHTSHIPESLRALVLAHRPDLADVMRP